MQLLEQFVTLKTKKLKKYPTFSEYEHRLINFEVIASKKYPIFLLFKRLTADGLRT